MILRSRQSHSGQRCGFTLLEMAVVIAIIGLIIGGIMVGKSVKRQAEIQAMLGEYDQYIKAIKEFQDKYNALPGDMSNATSIWGSNPNGCGGGNWSATPTTLTCNGDGNGTIGSSSTAGVLSNSVEWWFAWQQLADAGFIAGTFTGNPSPFPWNSALAGTNVPASNLKGGGWTLNYYLFPNNGVNSNAGAPLWMDQYGHVLNFGGYVAGDYTKGAVLGSAEALNIDQKIDDGQPGTGKIRAWRTGVLPNCISGDGDANQTTATYNTNYATQACALVFILGF